MKRLLVILLVLAISLSGLFAAGYETLEGVITGISKYGNAATDISEEKAISAGYEAGDMVTLTVGSYTAQAPLGTDYSNVDSGNLVAVLSDEGIEVAINYGSFATVSGAAVGDAITIDMAEKGGYAEEYAVRQLERTDNREDYASDEVFANFRMIDEGNIAPGVLYRSCSPVRGDARAPYADSLAKENGIVTVINLADSEESMKEGLANAPYYSTLAENGNVITLDMGVDFFAPEFTEKLAAGLRFMISHDAPYLIHCNEGKDRAGMTAALLEALSGAAMEEIIADYMESYENYYGVEEGSEQYNVISKIITDFFETMNGRPFPYSMVRTVAEQYTLNTIGLTMDELASLENILQGK